MLINGLLFGAKSEFGKWIHVEISICKTLKIKH